VARLFKRTPKKELAPTSAGTEGDATLVARLHPSVQVSTYTTQHYYTYSITDNSNQQSYSRIVQILVFIILSSIHIYLYIFAGHKEEQPTVSGNMKN
jgi:hypothetical protein